MRVRLLITAISLLAGSALAGAIELPPQFSSGMILQRGRDNYIWGKRSEGLATNVFLEIKDAAGASLVREDSNRKNPQWTITIPDSKSRKWPATITIWEGNDKGGKQNAVGEKILLQDVQLGDVWILAVSPDQGFTNKPPQNLNARILWLNNVAALDSALPANQVTWSQIVQFDRFPVIAQQAALGLCAADNATPIGLIVTSTAGWPGKLLLGPWDSQREKLTVSAMEISRNANRMIDKQKEADEKIQIQFKHEGRVTNSVDILAYADLVAVERKRESATSKQTDWQYKGALVPGSAK